MTGVSGVNFSSPNDKSPKTTSIKRGYDDFNKSTFTSFNEYRAKLHTDFQNFRNQPQDVQTSVDENSQTFTSQYNINENVTDHPPVFVNEEALKAYEKSHGELPSKYIVDGKEVVRGENSVDNNSQTVITPQYNVNENVTDHPPVFVNEEALKDYEKAHGELPSKYIVDDGEAVQDKSSQSQPKAEPSQESATSKVKPSKVNAGGVSGSYIITQGEDGKGCSVKSNMYVELNKSEVNKFFNPQSVLSRDNEGNYEFRGIKSKSYNLLQSKLTNTAQKIAISQAIYSDLMTKKNSGTELSEPEQNFVNMHLKLLDRYNLCLDGSGNLIDKSK